MCLTIDAGAEPHILRWELPSVMVAVSLNDLLLNLRVADLLDVLLATVFISLALRWLWRGTSQTVAVAVIGSVAIYVMARLLDMYLTLAVFQIGLTVFLLVLAIVFQQDIRHELERLSFSQLFMRRRPPASSSRFLSTLVEGTSLLAEQRIGALIVLKGRQPLERHTRGGIRADALVTIPLLHSIFNPKSQGHDGAALIVGERLVSFGVHLPLSTNLRKCGAGGTRHAAALGLAEQTDALVIVVSEERGSISLADGSELNVLKSAADLQEHLETFLRNRSTARDRRTSTRSPLRGLALNATALLIACGLWFVFAFRIETVQQTFENVPVEFRSVPDGWRLEESESDFVNLKLTGPERAFDQLDPRKLKVSLELSDLTEGEQEVSITPKDIINLPSDITLRRVDAPSVRVNLQRYVDARLPIHIFKQGQPPKQVQLVSIQPEVDTWPVLMPNSDSMSNERVTARIDLSAITKTVTKRVALEYPEGVVPAKPDRRLSVTVVVKPADVEPASGPSQGRTKSGTEIEPAKPPGPAAAP